MNIHPTDIATAAAHGANMMLEVTHADLTQTTAATAQSLTAPVVAKQAWRLVHAVLLEPFEDTTDTGNNTVAVTVGDTGSATRYLASMELAKNGSYVSVKQGALNPASGYVYTADDTLTLAFGAPAAGKTLAALNKGRVQFFFQVDDARYQN